jgi:hypothetical protein
MQTININFRDFLLLHESSSIEKFYFNDLSEIQKDKLYAIVKQSYQQRTGNVWDKETFFRKANDWEFHGTMPQGEGNASGFVAVKNKSDSSVKLVVAAGNPLTVWRVLKELFAKNLPLWAVPDRYLATHLQRIGFKEPPVRVTAYILHLYGMPNQSLNDDGTFSQQQPDGVSSLTKQFLASPAFFRHVLRKHGNQIPADIKEEIENLASN